MKLSDFYSDLIIESKKPERFRVWPNIVIDNYVYRIYSSKEQFDKRNGYLNAISNEMINNIDPDQKYAEGVPNKVIRDSIKRNIDKIVDSFITKENFYGKGKRIIFSEVIIENELRPNDKYYIEYVLEFDPQIYDSEFSIITSALSSKGTFLRSLKRNDPKVSLSESIEFKNLELVFLSN
jgi:hypothetical protein